jgi:DNA-binding transcriptional MerR regulator
MKNVNVFLKEIKELKAGMEKSTEISKDSQLIILERKQKELKRKSEQISNEIEHEVEDFFGYLNLKQASIETLSTMSIFVEEELKKIERQIETIKVTRSE